MSQGGCFFIDSLVPHMWLPLEVCQATEAASGLVLDGATELYLLKSTQHARSRQQSPTITFTIEAQTQGGDTTTITLPYDVFDLNVSAPIGERKHLRTPHSSELRTARNTHLGERFCRRRL